ncbi:PAS domain S-box protein [Luteimonas yindakuii]|nr:PAS domain S-box protein [Luteimonas yindakuii]
MYSAGAVHRRRLRAASSGSPAPSREESAPAACSPLHTGSATLAVLPMPGHANAQRSRPRCLRPHGPGMSPNEPLEFRRLADTAPAILWVTDADGHCTFMSRGWHEMTGQSEAESLGFGWLDALHPDDLPIARTRLARAQRLVKPFTIDYRVRCRDGRYRWMLDAANPRHAADGSFAGFAGSVIDIDDRRRSEDKYRALFDSIEEGFCIVQMLFDDRTQPRDYRFLEVNPAFSRHTGLVDPVGHTAREMLPDLEPHWFEIYGRIAVTGEPERFEAGSDAMDRWFEVYAFRIGDPAERLVALLFTDITARRRQQQALREADQRKDEFLATLAHELRNPLAPIRTSLYVLKLNQDPETGARMLDILMRQVDQLTHLVDDLTEVSRITRGRIELRAVDIPLGSVLRNAAESVQPTLDQNRQTLQVDLPADPLWLRADPVRLGQVFVNLLNNAARYSREDTTIRVTAKAEGGEAVVSVCDEGMGIAREHLQSIFDLFTQVDRQRSADTRGLGIGLALVRSLVQMHGGNVSARSDGAGQGAEFVVRLPLQTPGGETPSRVEDNAAKPFGGLRVLVADDNRDAAESMGEWLSAFGAETIVVHDGHAALTMAQMHMPHVALLDLGMPELSGLEVAQRLRAVPGGAGMRLIAITGWGQARDRAGTEAAGFDHHMTKPPDIALLRSLLQDAHRALVGQAAGADPVTG